MKIEFTLTSKQQIRELFLRMYCVDSRKTARLPTNLKQIMPDVLKNGVPAELFASTSNKGKHEKQKAPTPELEKLADTFAKRLPDGIFSSAEVQGYLIMRKKDPCKAINEIDAWREAEMANKEKRKLEGSKVEKAGER
ncbi:hypothetical protein GJ744_009607 [Endocarpon pusillum]|uniref:Mitochondrial chaperone BCS1-like ATPase lid domain-containing protein n=1 Tax=Endocarpon pusillum TaxID=364733 RepID=A0A8H7A6E3_9EURO|nr:hypothetical protein GJ744_009607 [Endocarpon pusillum]